MRGTTFTFPHESRTLLESPGVTVEFAFVNDGAKRFLVIVHQVALNSDSSPETPAVVKFSERQYALPHSQSVQLATPEFYRSYPGEYLGIRDEEDASYIRSKSDGSRRSLPTLRRAPLPSSYFRMTDPSEVMIREERIYLQFIDMPGWRNWAFPPWGSRPFNPHPFRLRFTFSLPSRVRLPPGGGTSRRGQDPSPAFP